MDLDTLSKLLPYLFHSLGGAGLRGLRRRLFHRWNFLGSVSLWFRGRGDGGGLFFRSSFRRSDRYRRSGFRIFGDLLNHLQELIFEGKPQHPECRQAQQDEDLSSTV